MGEPPRVARAADDRALADLHRRVFPDHAASRFGRGTSRALVRRYRSRPDGVVLLVDGPAGPVGYLVAATPDGQSAVTSALARRAAVASLARPRSLLASVRAGAARLARRRRRRSPATAQGAPAPARRRAPFRVVLVGVAPELRGRGVVDALLDAAVAEGATRGHAVVDLVVASDNVVARRAYARNGWQVAPGGDPDGASVRLEHPTDLG